MIVDLHSHSTASDGDLSPTELLERAAQNGVELMAITDHDSMDGYLAVRKQPVVRLVAGVELSCVWGKALVHIVGLNMEPDDSRLRRVLASQQQARNERAQLIGEKLSKYGFVGGYHYAAELAGNSQIGRPHFARFLLDMGYVSSTDQAYKKYLGAGKAGDIKLTWPAMATAVGWIVESGGVAILAHPLHYSMTATRLRALLGDFKQAGGQGLEVISGRQSGDNTRYLSGLAEQFELLASIGSDFHKPDVPWSELGQMGRLPDNCRPVWSHWL